VRRTAVVLIALLSTAGLVGGITTPLNEYTWQIDRAHRRLESALLALTDRALIEAVVRDARQAYDLWLDDYLRSFTASADEAGLVTEDQLLPKHKDANPGGLVRKLGHELLPQSG
jgi:hypothetical protein